MSIEVIQRWTKRASGSDVNRPRPGTHIQNHMTLVQGGHPIDKGTYFREEFFTNVDWDHVSTVKEEAPVVMEVIGRGRELGYHEVIVGHKPAYEANQSNRSSFIQWNAELGQILSGEYDFTGDYASLEKLADGTYRLTFDHKPTGEFVK